MTKATSVLEERAVVREYPDNSLGEQVRAQGTSFSILGMLKQQVEVPSR